MPGACDDMEEHCGAIPDDAQPCDDDARAVYWPLALRSERYPFVVRYARHDQEATAALTVEHLDAAWSMEVEQLGFSAPLPDHGLCGDDDAFDVFLWRDIGVAYVEAIADEPATPHDDWITYMAVDAWGEYGGPALASTLAHELNHALQASDDWWESAAVFEMTATFVEELARPDDDIWHGAVVGDFQQHPDWALDHDDEYATWHMYGAALYLHYLRDRWFDGDAGFAAAMWRGLRIPPGADEDLALNEPDFADALDALLAPRGTSYVDSLVEFARWRWYTGARDDGRHFRDGARLGASADVRLAADVDAVPAAIVIEPAPMLLGSAYVRVRRRPGQPATLVVRLESAAGPEVRWVMQAVPGPAGAGQGDDGALLEPGAALDLSSDAEQVLVLTALPAGPYDPDVRTAERYPVTLILE
jgi:hypothetical protein